MLSRPVRENTLIGSLSAQSRRSLDRDLRDFHLQEQTLLRGSRGVPSIVFPRTCVISVITRTNDGQTLDNALVGYEGVFATPAEALNVNGLVQIAGFAYGLSHEAFDKHLDNHEFREAISRYSECLLSFACQSAICQAFHTAEQRLARWLLSVQDRAQDDELRLTQEYLAAMLGVHRPTVTIAARILQAAGMIHYRYGRIAIADRAALEEAACECYQMVPRPNAASLPAAIK